MGNRLEVTPSHLRSGADRIDAANTAVIGLSVPNATPAAAGLNGFATGAALPGARAATTSSLKTVGGRWQKMATLIRDTANGFEIADLTAPGMLPNSWMSEQVGNGLAGMGDLSPSQPR